MGETALIGMGMGYEGGLTVEAQAFIREADLLIGAGRMLRSASALSVRKDVEMIQAYLPGDVQKVMQEHPQAEKTAVLLSGDTGFFSGADALLRVMPDDVRIMPGISCVSYFCSRLHRSWQDIRFISLHGKKSNIIGEVLHHPSVMAILGSDHDVKDICRAFLTYELPELQITVGSDFGTGEEKIVSGKPSDFLSFTCSPLSVILVERPAAWPEVSRFLCGSVPDGAFIRGKVPMTKEEVRTITIARLGLTSDAVVYDIGAGTGSVSIEAALRAYRGQVFAVEKNPDAIELIRANARRFHTPNVTAIEGKAPQILQNLPAPTHVFIGGSSGNFQEIVHAVRRKSPSVRIVGNAVTLETLEAARQALGEEADITCISSARADRIGAYHLMRGMDPVYIFSAGGLP